MESHRSQVILLRAWLEDNGLRVRILVADGPQRRWVVAGVEPACSVVEALLRELASPTKTNQDGPLTP